MAKPCIVSKLLPSPLTRNDVYRWLNIPLDGTLKFNLDSETLFVVRRPIFNDIPSSSIQIIMGDHGHVGLVVFSYQSLQMWEHMLNRHGTAIWVPR